MDDEFVPGLRYVSVAQEIWALLGQVGGGLFEQRCSAAAAALGLSPASAAALMKLLPGEPISQKELSARLRCSPSTVVDPTDRLERLGLVTRQVQAGDRRVNALMVTQRGAKVRDDLIARIFEPPAPLLDMAPEHQARFRDVLRGLAATHSEA